MSTVPPPEGPIQSNYPRPNSQKVEATISATSRDIYNLYKAYNLCFLALLGIVPIYLTAALDKVSNLGVPVILIGWLVGYGFSAGVYFVALSIMADIEGERKWLYKVGAFVLPFFALIGFIVAMTTASGMMKKRGARMTQKKDVEALWNQLRAQEGLSEETLSVFKDPYK